MRTGVDDPLASDLKWEDVAVEASSAQMIPRGVWRGEGSVTLAQGVLNPGTLVAWSDHAVLDAKFSSFHRLRIRRTRRFPFFGRRFVVFGRRFTLGRPFALPMIGRPTWTATDLADMVVIDEMGTDYPVRRVVSVSFARRLSGHPEAPVDVEVHLEPAPPAGAGWVEIRGQGTSAARLVQGERFEPRAQPAIPLDDSATQREVNTLARSLLALSLFAVKKNHPEFMRQRCAEALARARELAAGASIDDSLLEDLTSLCAVLQGTGEAPELPPHWAIPLHAADAEDGPALHLNLGTALPVFSGLQLAVGALVSESSLWHLTVSAAPSWWQYSEDRRRKWAPFHVWAQDDRGSHYVSMFGGSAGAEGHEDLTFRFRPRLDPDARLVRIVFEGPDAALPVEVALPT